MGLQNEFRIEPRSEDDLRREISRLAASYTPQWLFDEDHPDAGTVIGLIFAGQMAENIRKMNRVLEKYHTEFVNMLNISLLPAHPAEGVAVLDLMEGAVPGVDVPKGTRLLGAHESENTRGVVFETTSDIHITDARLSDVLMISGSLGRIIPVLGGSSTPELVPDSVPESVEPEGPAAEMEPVSLFDFRQNGIERNALLMYHRNLFDTAPDVSLFLRMRDAEKKDCSSGFADPSRYRWSYYGENGLVPFDGVEARNGTVVLEKSGDSGKLRLDGGAYSMLCLEAIGPARNTVDLSELSVCSSCRETEPEFVLGGTEELPTGDFMPFGETVSVFDECYIGHDRIFSQQGARITLSFSLSNREKLMTLPREQEKNDLKIIKRKPRTVQFETVRTSPQRVSFAYFNGTGWRKLDCERDWSTLFDGTHAGEQKVSFACPEDWQPTVAGGYNRRCLRVRVLQADNCYLQPCIHTMPVVGELRLTYSYDGSWKTPQRLIRVCGTEHSDVTLPMLSGKPFTAFSPLPCTGNALLLGFDRRMEGAPVSILFDIEQSVPFSGSPLSFEYSAASGFKPLKVIDHTRNLTSAGTLLFVPPADFTKRTVEGKSCYWLRIADERGAYDRPDRPRAVIRRILPNAVEIRNVQTMPEEPFYIEAAAPNMQFPLSAQNVLRADVFVNELGSLSRSEMQKMLAEQPENVRVGYDYRGEFSEFFVRWTEVANFDQSLPSDRHYTLDRLQSSLHFGDGVSVRIPQARSGVAFLVRPVCCDGTAGNLPAGAVNSSFSLLLYINRIYNPIATYGGDNIESMENARRRGANIINSRNRLVSELDFVREVRAYSGAVDKVKCVVGFDPEGKRSEKQVTVAVMMRDYAGGAYSFSSVKDRLREHLLKKCEATLPKTDLVIAEPSYVEISVDVWVRTSDADRTFEIQNIVREQIRAFLEPLSGTGRPGWEIGELPTEFQIRQMLQSVRCGASVGRSVITARYTDWSGTHERDLSDLAPTPFMIGINGRHTVHVAAVQ